ncbi:zeta toxin family protein [Mucilaginibacter aquariorum]|uniref:Zeta toxin family protein n=1 Tax=Mucilaginibacter aquariorum TaxID=2967225 RepID=A0ABT1T8X3_9SPHI|nr:zeta toxin family protein [Mucilaginibacter aquariorum]MCQ6961059.1 zeta toxin family protein [Mucilaginibacter aquariorum]
MAQENRLFQKICRKLALLFLMWTKLLLISRPKKPDIIKKHAYQEATKEFFIQAAKAIEKRQHFTLETNFRDDNLMDIVAEFKRFGYTTNMIYLTLESIRHSIDRVNERVANGGHYVDQNNIEQNFDLGLQYLEKFAEQFDNLEIIDASGTDWQLRSLLSIQNRKLTHISDNVPERLTQTVNVIVDRFTPPPPKQELRPYRGPRR